MAVGLDRRRADELRPVDGISNLGASAAVLQASILDSERVG
jgi:hypothetical protein